MALVGPNVPPVDFSTLLYTLRQVCIVSGLRDGVLAISLTLGECIVILPVPNGHCIRLFISVTSLLDVDSPKGRSLPCADSALSPLPLAILNGQRLLPVDFFSPVFMALLLLALSSSVGCFD